MGGGLNVWVLQTGEPLPTDPGDPRPMRAMNLCSKLLDAGHRVVLWSSRFDHQRKIHRPEPPSDRWAAAQPATELAGRLDVRLIPSRGYRKHIGPGRLLDHAELGWNLRRMLRLEPELPDVAFVGYPPIETAAVMTRWLGRRGVPVLLDVKDQWPTIFLSALPRAARAPGAALLWPLFRLARHAMREATGLSAMAEGFLGWALAMAEREREVADGVFPLTSRLDRVAEAELADARAWWGKRGVEDNGMPRFMFVGSHSRAFDFQPLRRAARRCLDEGLSCQFVLCGEGESSAELRRSMQGLSNVLFPGWVDRPRLVALAERSYAALAPYRDSPDFRLSLPNKVLDALSLGLPILSPLPGEVRALIEHEGIGLAYGEDTGRDLLDCIVELMRYPSLQAELGAAARDAYARLFAYEKVYGDLVRHLERLAARGGIEAHARLATQDG